MNCVQVWSPSRSFVKPGVSSVPTWGWTLTTRLLTTSPEASTSTRTAVLTSLSFWKPSGLCTNWKTRSPVHWRQWVTAVWRSITTFDLSSPWTNTWGCNTEESVQNKVLWSICWIVQYLGPIWKTSVSGIRSLTRVSWFVIDPFFAARKYFLHNEGSTVNRNRFCPFVRCSIIIIKMLE